MENKPLEMLSPEISNVVPSLKNIQTRIPVVPAYESIPCQMSPFSDERWELEVAEQKRRKEIHREYVYNYRKPVPYQPQPPPGPVAVRQEELQSAVLSPRMNAEQPKPEIEETVLESEPIRKDFFKREPLMPKPKPLSELKFDVPTPLNLYPVLKFPEKYRLEPVNDYPINVPSIGKTGVRHYGIHVPFWEFSSNA